MSNHFLVFISNTDYLDLILKVYYTTLAQSCLQIVMHPFIKSIGKIKLLPFSISVIKDRTPEIPHSNSIYEVDFNTFQLPEGIIPLDIMHPLDHKMPEHSKFPFCILLIPFLV